MTGVVLSGDKRAIFFLLLWQFRLQFIWGLNGPGQRELMSNPFDERFATRAAADMVAGTLVGKYELEEAIGRGGMGQVWRARDTVANRQVALKMLPPEFRGNSDAISQVQASFDVVHRLSHQSICKVLDLNIDPRHGPYIVMDLVEGISLSEYARRHRDRHGSWSAEEVARVLRPIAEALDYAHGEVFRTSDGRQSRGVLHRDVKPHNILVVTGKDGEWQKSVLIDFGLASEIRSSMTRHTQATVDTRGTRPYMSPEQLRGKRKEWDGRLDQYSLGVVAYELLAGHLPFEGEDEFALMLSIYQEPPEAIPEVSGEVNACLLRALSKAGADRFGSCVEFIGSLSSGVGQQPAVSAVGAVHQRSSEAVATSELTNSIGMRLVRIPAGSFRMGSPETEEGRYEDEVQHKVTLTRDYWLGVTPVTQS